MFRDVLVFFSVGFISFCSFLLGFISFRLVWLGFRWARFGLVSFHLSSGFVWFHDLFGFVWFRSSLPFFFSFHVVSFRLLRLRAFCPFTPCFPKAKDGYGSPDAIAAFVSNCDMAGASKRFEYIQQLMNYSTVHSFGACLHNMFVLAI